MGVIWTLYQSRDEVTLWPADGDAAGLDSPWRGEAAEPAKCRRFGGARGPAGTSSAGPAQPPASAGLRDVGAAPARRRRMGTGPVSKTPRAERYVSVFQTAGVHSERLPAATAPARTLPARQRGGGSGGGGGGARRARGAAAGQSYGANWQGAGGGEGPRVAQSAPLESAAGARGGSANLGILLSPPCRGEAALAPA